MRRELNPQRRWSGARQLRRCPARPNDTGAKQSSAGRRRSRVYRHAPGHPTAASTQLSGRVSRGCCRGSCPRLGSDACRPSPPADKGLAPASTPTTCLKCDRPQPLRADRGSATSPTPTEPTSRERPAFQRAVNANRLSALRCARARHGGDPQRIALPRAWPWIPYGGHLPWSFAVTWWAAMPPPRPSRTPGDLRAHPRFDSASAEDGPNHQPVETLASLRSIPNLLVIPPRRRQ